jgi:hypothetical protein
MVSVKDPYRRILGFLDRLRKQENLHWEDLEGNVEIKTGYCMIDLRIGGGWKWFGLCPKAVMVNH